MSNDSNITIGIGADASKLRAELEIAKAELRKFNTDLNAAARNAVATGDKAGVVAAAEQAALASKRVTELKPRWPASAPRR